MKHIDYVTNVDLTATCRLEGTLQKYQCIGYCQVVHTIGVLRYFQARKHLFLPMYFETILFILALSTIHHLMSIYVNSQIYRMSYIQMLSCTIEGKISIENIYYF